MPKVMNHNEYPKMLAGKSDAELRFIIQDCKDAIAAMPEGENVGYYADEVIYCSTELQRRGSIDSVNRKIDGLGLKGILRAESPKGKIQIIDVEINCVIYYANDRAEGELFVMAYWAGRESMRGNRVLLP